MARNYHLKNIRTLLLEGFNDEDLRQLCYDVPKFRPVYHRLSRNSSKAEIIDRLIEYAEQTLQIDNLLDLAKEHNSARYLAHQPYYYETDDNTAPNLDVSNVTNLFTTQDRTRKEPLGLQETIAATAAQQSIVLLLQDISERVEEAKKAIRLIIADGK